MEINILKINDSLNFILLKPLTIVRQSKLCTHFVSGKFLPLFKKIVENRTKSKYK